MTSFRFIPKRLTTRTTQTRAQGLFATSAKTAAMASAFAGTVKPIDWFWIPKSIPCRTFTVALAPSHLRHSLDANCTDYLRAVSFQPTIGFIAKSSSSFSCFVTERGYPHNATVLETTWSTPFIARDLCMQRSNIVMCVCLLVSEHDQHKLVAAISPVQKTGDLN